MTPPSRRAASLARQRAIDLGHEERFRFIKGFNDVFFTIGVVLFLLGVAYLHAARHEWHPPHWPRWCGHWRRLLVARCAWCCPASCSPSCSWPGVRSLRGAAGGSSARLHIEWHRRRRSSSCRPAVLPRRAAGVRGAGAGAGGCGRRHSTGASSCRSPCCRMAVSLVVAALGGGELPVSARAGRCGHVFSLVSGLAVFAAAMSFDMSDRERITRWADCAFWLHLLAAPLIVRSAIVGSAPCRSPAVPSSGDPGARRDRHRRRAGTGGRCSSTGARCSWRASPTSAGPSLYLLSGDRAAHTLAATLVILGAIVLTLGAGWVPLRRLLLALLPSAISNRLPRCLRDPDQTMTSFSPREIVSELDRYIVGQKEAKRAVAIALRNRWRRQQLPEGLKEEVLPKNILMIGPDRLRQDRDLAPPRQARRRAVPEGGGHQVHRGRLRRPRRGFHRARPGRGGHRPGARDQAQGGAGAGREERRGAGARRPGRRGGALGHARDVPAPAAGPTRSTTRRWRSRWPRAARSSRPSTSPAARSG